MRVRFLSAADEEYADSALYYLEESPRAAEGFVASVEEAIAEIVRTPLMYPIHSGQIHVKVLDKYPFSIYYRIDESEILILAVAHQGRMTDYWKGRSNA